VAITGSLPSSSMIPQQQQPHVTSAAAPTLTLAPRGSAKSFAAAPSSSTSLADATIPASAALSTSNFSSHPSGCLDLTDSDWSDLRWLVAAHPAAFTAAGAAPGSPGSSSGGASLPDPTLAPASTLVSASALQICMQHYLSRWLNAHELSVIASLLKFVRGATAGSKQQPGDDLLSYQVLERAVRCLHALIAAQPRAQVIDPLPAFAQAMGLLGGGDTGAAPVLSTEELLAHLNSFAILTPQASLGLLHSFGPEVLHAPEVQELLALLRQSRAEHTRLQKEHGLLTAARENLDSSHQDLSERVPYLQSALEQARREKLELQAELDRAQEADAQSHALRAAYDKMQKKVQELQDQAIELRADLQHAKEAALASDAEQATLQSANTKARERIGALEKELRDAIAAAQAQQVQDQAALASLSESARLQSQQLADAKEQAQVYRRRLAATGDLDGLDTIGGGPMIQGGTSPLPETGIVGSLARSLAQRIPGVPASLSSEIADFDRGDALNRVAAQAHEIEQLQRQAAALNAALGQRDREIERLHNELERAAPSSDHTQLGGQGPTSDGEEQSKGCCSGCVVM